MRRSIDAAWLLDRSAGLESPLASRSARRPTHVIYGSADRFRATTAERLAELAREALETYAPRAHDLAEALSVPVAEVERIHPRLVAKLAGEAVEDLRIDFEDGFGPHTDAEEDDAAIRAAKELARGQRDRRLPEFIGLRVRALAGATAERAVRTLDLFLTALFDAGASLPEGFVVTWPKVRTASQVATMADLADALESALGLPTGALRFELMIETPASLVAADGRAAIPALLSAGRGRVRGLHLGTYDLTADLGVVAAHQRPDHPVADFARTWMSLTAAESGVWLSDGATAQLPIAPHRDASLTPSQRVENRAAVHSGWAVHHHHVRRALSRGLSQGWDLHPAQIPARHAGTIGFFLEGLDAVVDRLARFVAADERATRTGGQMDDRATARGLVLHVKRGLDCGALNDDDVAGCGISAADLRAGDVLS